MAKSKKSNGDWKKGNDDGFTVSKIPNHKKPYTPKPKRGRSPLHHRRSPQE